MRVIFFDVDGTLLDDETAIARGLDALHASYGATLGLGRDALGHQWQQSLERHFPRFLAGEISTDEQRRARMRDLFGSVTTAARCDEAFAVYLDAYENAWAPYDDVRRASFIGDDWAKDVVGSREAGLQPIWLRREPSAAQPVLPGVRVIETLHELGAVLAAEPLA